MSDSSILGPERSQIGIRGLSVALVVAALVVATTGVVVLLRVHRPLSVQPPTVPAADSRACARVTAILPPTVAGEGHRAVRPRSALTAAWGSPASKAIVLRCGVRDPGPTVLPCSRIGDVDWILVRDEGTALLETYGRHPTVEVQIPQGFARDRVLDALGPSLAGLARTGPGCVTSTGS